jgi:hypothetical protein
MDIDIVVPEGLQDITLEQYQRFLALKSEDETFLSQKAVEIFCHVPLVLVDRMPYNTVQRLAKRVFSYFEGKPSLIMKKALKKRLFGFVPNLEEITLGEYVDLDANIADWKNMHRAMAVLYRPVVTEADEYYDIEEYDGTNKYAETMKEMPLDVVLGALVFFYRLGIDLSIAMTAYLEEDKKLTSHQKPTSEESGGGTEVFINSLKETLQGLKQLADSPFTAL